MRRATPTSGIDRAIRPYRPLPNRVRALHPLGQAAPQLGHRAWRRPPRPSARLPSRARRSSLDGSEPRAGSACGARVSAVVTPALEPAAPQLLFGPGQRDIEQTALLIDGGRRLRRRDGHQAFAEAEHDDRGPLQALGPVEGGEHDAVPIGGLVGHRRDPRGRGRRAAARPLAGRRRGRGRRRRPCSAPAPRPSPPARWRAARWCA